MTEAEVRAAFDTHWPALEKAIASYGPTHTAEDVWERIADGRAALWTDGETAAVTTVEAYPTGFRELRIWLCGGKLKEARRLEQRIVAYGRKHGFERVSIVGRRPWLRALRGWNEAATVMVKDLKA